MELKIYGNSSPVDFIQEIQKEEIEGCNSDEILSPADVEFVVNPVKVKF